MKNENKMTSFERMNIAASEMVKEDLGVTVACCKSHTSKTLKVIAHPDKPNTVDLYIPYQIFVGAKTNPVCENWEVNYWKEAFRGLNMEFGVKDCPLARLMSRKNRGVNPRVYANFFWKSIESMDGWNIILPEVPALSKKPILEIAVESVQLKGVTEADSAKEKINVEEAYDALGIKFACL